MTNASSIIIHTSDGNCTMCSKNWVLKLVTVNIELCNVITLCMLKEIIRMVSLNFHPPTATECKNKAKDWGQTL